jgi:hypothetical protein
MCSSGAIKKRKRLAELAAGKNENWVCKYKLGYLVKEYVNWERKVRMGNINNKLF